VNAKPGSRILLVDDDSFNTESAARVLAGMQYSVTACSNAHDAGAEMQGMFLMCHY